MAGASAGELRLVDRVRVELSRRFPEGTQRTASAGVVPDARDHDSTSPDHPRHLVQPGDRIRHEVDDELGERRIEAVVGEGECLGARLPNVDPGVPLPRRSDERLRGVGGGDRIGAQARHQLGGERARPAPDVDHPLPGIDAREIRQLRRQEPRPETHEPVVRVR